MSSIPTTSQSYNPFSKFLHWLMAILWMAAWPIGLAAVHMRDEWNAHHELTVLHKEIASIIIFLTVLRIIWRWIHRAPDFPASMSPRMKRAAHAGHIALYALALIALPLSGWMWSSVADKPIMILGLLQLTPLTAPMPEFYDLAKLVHRVLSWSLGVMVLGHIGLALKHHFIDRDSALLSMLPRGRIKR